MGITYDAPSNTITVTGYTAGTPCNLTDIYNADVAGGWGVVTLQGTSQFLFDCKLVIGVAGTATYFKDLNKQVRFSSLALSANGQTVISVKTDATFTLGEVRSATDKSTRRGCHLSIKADYSSCYLIGRQSATAYVNLYGSSFHAERDAGLGIGTDAQVIWNCEFTDMADIMWKTALTSGSFHNVIRDGYDTIWVLTDISGISPLQQGLITAQRYAVRFESLTTSVTLSGFTISAASLRVAACTAPIYLKNCNLNNWVFVWASSTPDVFRQYEFDLTVTDYAGVPINAATVTLKDKDNSTVFSVSTDANGNITTQTVSRGYYNQANGDTLQEYSPHTLTIIKGGYQTYSIPFTLTEKTKWTIKLPKAKQILLDNGKLILNLNPSEPENNFIMSL